MNNKWYAIGAFVLGMLVMPALIPAQGAPANVPVQGGLATATMAAPPATATLVPTSTPAPEPTADPSVAAAVPAVVAEDVIANVSPEALMQSPYMTRYQGTLEYTVPADMQVPADTLAGFWPVPSLVNVKTQLPDGTKVEMQKVPADLAPYSIFADVPDKTHPQPRPWGRPIASFRDSQNKFCRTTSGWCSDNIESYNWQVITAERLCHPAVGCIKDPNGGAAMLLIVNFHDSDEAFDARNGTGVFALTGFSGFGKMWDLSGKTYNLGMGISTIRNHYMFHLSSNPDYDGACGSSKLCGSVTYVVVARIWDRPELGINYSHFELLEAGHWGK